MDNGPCPSRVLDRTRYLMRAEKRRGVPGLDHLEDWIPRLETLKLELDNRTAAQDIPEGNVVRRLLESIEKRRTKVSLDIALLNMEGAAFFLACMKLGSSDLPGDKKALKALLDVDSDQGEVKGGYDAWKYRSPLYAAAMVSPLLLLMGEDLITKVQRSTLAQLWLHHGNAKPLALVAAEHALWRELMSMVTQNRSAEQALRNFLTRWEGLSLQYTGVPITPKVLPHKVDANAMLLYMEPAPGFTPEYDMDDVSNGRDEEGGLEESEGEEELPKDGEHESMPPPADEQPSQEKVDVPLPSKRGPVALSGQVNEDPSIQSGGTAGQAVSPMLHPDPMVDQFLKDSAAIRIASPCQLDPSSDLPLYQPSPPTHFYRLGSANPLHTRASIERDVQTIPFFDLTADDALQPDSPLYIPDDDEESWVSDEDDLEIDMEEFSHSSAYDTDTDEEPDDGEIPPDDKDDYKFVNKSFSYTSAYERYTDEELSSEEHSDAEKHVEKEDHMDTEDADGDMEIDKEIVDDERGIQEAMDAHVDMDIDTEMDVVEEEDSHEDMDVDKDPTSSQMSTEQQINDGEPGQAKEDQEKEEGEGNNEGEEDGNEEEGEEAGEETEGEESELTDLETDKPELTLRRSDRNKNKNVTTTGAAGSTTSTKKRKKKDSQASTTLKKKSKDTSTTSPTLRKKKPVKTAKSKSHNTVTGLPPFEDFTERKIQPVIGKTYVLRDLRGSPVVHTVERFLEDDLEDFDELIEKGNKLTRTKLQICEYNNKAEPSVVKVKGAVKVLGVQNITVHDWLHYEGVARQVSFAQVPYIIERGENYQFDNRTIIEMLMSLGNIFTPRTVHDLSLFSNTEDADPDEVHVEATLWQLVQHSKGKGQVKPVNVLSMPSSGDNTWMPTALFTDMVAYNSCNDARPKDDAPLPSFVLDTRWSLFALKHAFHRGHVDAAGFCTIITVQEGYKLVSILIPENIDDWTPAASLEFFRGLELNLRNTVGFKVVTFLLAAGDSIVMPPMTVHYVSTIETSACRGGHFYCMSTMRRTCWALLHMVHHDNFTNTEHDCHRAMLSRIMEFWASTILDQEDFYLAYGAANDQMSDLPNLQLFSGLLDFLYLLNLMELGRVLWREQYNHETVPKEDVKLYSHALARGEQVLDWFETHFVLRGFYLEDWHDYDKWFTLSIRHLRESLLIQQVCALLRQAKESTKPSSQQVMSAIKEQFRGKKEFLAQLKNALDAKSTIQLNGSFTYDPSHADSYSWAHECPKAGPFFSVGELADDGDYNHPTL
ncbi:hypothetical protein VNI00_016159 [Paramarasmius palmivorus]|uniref:JmjC domain-containing protein n=1 Tax=Paramarasmius palmivorus TaxID=297713 RepID=A0AAW0BGZ8_9AGAR